MHGQTLVVGFGVTGSSAASHLLACGADAADLVVLDADADAVRSATELGARALRGDGTDRVALARVASVEVDRIVIALVPDQTAVMSTMLARELCPSAMIVTAVREDAHVPTARASAPTTRWSPPRPPAMPWPEFCSSAAVRRAHRGRSLNDRLGHPRWDES
ncbi:NAD(P)-binding protein [Amycolatopsis sp. TRM77291]